jgi:ubiquinone/menaquinone biosynthesis C-methylase UbiE
MADVGRAIDELLGRHLHDEPIGALLDVGTGTGSMLRLMGRRVSRAVGIDASREMRLVARASVLAQGLANCTVCNEDMYGLSFGSASFDIVTMDRVLGAAAQPGTAVAEASRVLRPGGHMLVIEPSDSRIDDARLDAWGRTAGLDPLEVCHVSGRAAWVSLSRRRAQIGTEAA